MNEDVLVLLRHLFYMIQTTLKSEAVNVLHKADIQADLLSTDNSKKKKRKTYIYQVVINTAMAQ